MQVDRNAMRDLLVQSSGYGRGPNESTTLRGHGLAVVRNSLGEVTQEVSFNNLVTQVGDQYFGDRGAGIGSIAAITGMQLGTGSTTPAKTGAGAATVTLVAASLVALTGGFPASSLSGSSRRIQYQVLWGAGTATATGINEVILTNQATGTQTAVVAANCIARALLSPVVNKGASDTLTVTWNIDLLGA
jgi:hypothetical protein